jgi:hypothetical protein
MASAITFIGCVSYLFFDWRREKGDELALRTVGVKKLLKRILRL